MVWFLGQTPDPISGGAGWVGAGLLGAVLAWLCMVYLPAKDKQLRELLELIERVANTHRLALTEAIGAYKEELRYERTLLDQRNATIIAAIEENRRLGQQWMERMGLVIKQKEQS